MAHAYLFCGPEGAGKHTAGLAFAAALNCLEAPGVGCGRCEACSKIAGGIHPDVRTLERTGAAQIVTIDTVRGQVLTRLGLPPHEGRARVFLIEEAATLQGPAANALLKTLEEPPPRTHFIFGTNAPDRLLPTIRSRCQRVTFTALPPDVRAALHEDDEAAQRLAELADSLTRALDDEDAGAVYREAAAATANKEEIVTVLQLLAHRLHERATRAARGGALTQAAALGGCVAQVLETERAVIEHNAHGLMALEALLCGMRSELRASA